MRPLSDGPKRQEVFACYVERRSQLASLQAASVVLGLCAACAAHGAREGQRPPCKAPGYEAGACIVEAVCTELADHAGRLGRLAREVRGL